jgi:metal-responsive CopG/Arc/MetJ family transcriptional regulator
METIRVVLDKRLLRAVDRAARRRKLSRSALAREALLEHIRRLEIITAEGRERRGYARQPQSLDEVLDWEREAIWPAGK